MELIVEKKILHAPLTFLITLLFINLLLCLQRLQTCLIYTMHMSSLRPLQMYTKQIIQLTRINNVGRTLLLGLPHKNKMAPHRIHNASIGYISVKRGVHHLWRLIHGLLSMAMLAGPLMSVKVPGKLRNRRVAKSRIVLILINSVGRTLLLGLPRTQNGRPIDFGAYEGLSMVY